MTGSHEVRGSIPLGSTNDINKLGPPLSVALLILYIRNLSAIHEELRGRAQAQCVRASEVSEYIDGFERQVTTSQKIGLSCRC